MERFVIFVIFALFLQLLGVGAILTNTGTTVTLNGINYYINPYSVGSIAVPKSLDPFCQFVPLTAFTTDAKSLSISSVIQHYAVVDDVFQMDFLDIALVQHTGPSSSKVTITNAPQRTIMIQTCLPMRPT